MKRILYLTVFVAAMCLAEVRAEADYWPKDYAQSFAELPVQEGGRIKPMDTFARFKLISIHGKSRLTLNKKEKIKISAVEWLLDVFMRPEIAQDYPTFQINNAEVLTELGIAPHLKMSGLVDKDEAGTMIETNETRKIVVKRDYYSFNEIQPAVNKLRELGEIYAKLDGDTRTVVQQQIVDLETNFSTFGALTLVFKFAQYQLPLDPNNILAEEVPEGSKVPVSFLFENLDKVKQAGVGTEPIQRSSELLGAYMSSPAMLALFPPTEEDLKWIYPAQIMDSILNQETTSESRSRDMNRLKLLENLVTRSIVPDQRAAALAAYKEEVVRGAKAQGTYKDVISEVKFYKWKFFLLGPWLFVAGFALLIFNWLSPRSKLGRFSRWAAYLWFWIPTLALCAGITWRCLLRDRPPVTNLYETILFITAVACLMMLIIETIKRNGLALAIIPFFGAAGLFLAMRYELVDGQDTIAPLQAVLDTNFWLATHVTIVTMGYAAGLAAAAVSTLYILSRLIDPLKKRFPRSYYKDITGMAYGIICFGLLFSLVGTILGGIWANYSWGRFWGWDPKENGALMIVLMNLIILHGRIGGILKQLRLHMASVAGAIVVCYSWWGVNLLGAGLHSYGFTSGVRQALNMAYFSLSVIVVIGGLIGTYEWLIKRVAPEASKGVGTSKSAAS